MLSQCLDLSYNYKHIIDIGFANLISRIEILKRIVILEACTSKELEALDSGHIGNLKQPLEHH